MKILLELLLTFAKIGAFTFGGGYAMISIIDHECVEKKHWLTSDEMADMTVIAESTPGPIAINCATYAGFKLKGFFGALFATLGMVLPSFFIILLVSFFFENLLMYYVIAKAFSGVRIAVSILIIRVGIKMIAKMCKNSSGRRLTANICFVSMFFLCVFGLNILGINISTIYIIIVAGLLGISLTFLRKRREGMK